MGAQAVAEYKCSLPKSFTNEMREKTCVSPISSCRVKYADVRVFRNMTVANAISKVSDKVAVMYRTHV